MDLDKACTFLSTYDEITRWDGTSRPDSLRAVRRPLELGIALLVDCSDVVKRAGDLAIPDGPHSLQQSCAHGLLPNAASLTTWGAALAGFRRSRLPLVPRSPIRRSIEHRLEPRTTRGTTAD